MNLLLGIALFAIGLLLAIIGGFWTLILAFMDHWGWGLAYLFIPFAGLVFIIMKWSNQSVRRSVFLWLASLPLIGLGIWLGGLSAFDSISDTTIPLSEDNVSVEMPESEASIDTEQESSATQTPASSPTPGVAVSPSPTSPVSPAPNTTSSPAAQPDYTQYMLIGYAAFDQGDYQTALINFKRALDERPGDSYATKAIENTEAMINRNR
ncbi:hypothetical protein [Coleofasciculus sp. E2-BRE-01]|uniref:hypothetical protein n=1 Tax=Coleofasciculus sp. E2-BRE-01 TaxID=3069524 RepID=UPI0032FB05F7